LYAPPMPTDISDFSLSFSYWDEMAVCSFQGRDACTGTQIVGLGAGCGP
jgi:hypothetical protein